MDADLKRFHTQIDKFGDGIIKAVEKVIKKVTFDGVANLMIESPVDTGYFRASWLIGIDSEPGAIPKTLSGVAKVPSESEMMSQIGEFKIGGYIMIVNHVEYGIFLNEGHSTQAPPGFVDAIVADMKNALEHNFRVLGGL